MTFRPTEAQKRVTKDCRALTDAQWNLMKGMYRVPTTGRREYEVKYLLQEGHVYQTMRVLAEHRIVKFRCRNITTGRWEYVRLTKFGHDLAAFRAEYLHLMGIALNMHHRVQRVLAESKRDLDTQGRYWPVSGV